MESKAGQLTRDSAFGRYQRLGQSPSEVRVPVAFRVNTLKIQPEVLIPRLAGLGFEAASIPFLRYGFSVRRSRFSIGASVEYLMGYLYTQEAASQIPVQVLDPKPGECVADMAASPGGKTTQMAQWMKNEGVVVALDKAGRVCALKNNLERCGAANVVVYRKDARFLHELGMHFDKILLDAPCSGNFAGDPGWFGKRSLQGVHDRSALQKELMASAFHNLKPGGTLVYSTCSLEPEENEMVIDWALQTLKGLKVLPVAAVGDKGLVRVFGKNLHPAIARCRRLWPWKTQTQGFFIARLKKSP